MAKTTIKKRELKEMAKTAAPQSPEKWQGISALLECYHEMYQVADPPLNFIELYKAGKLAHGEWYLHHYLDSDAQQAIIDKIAIKYEMSEHQRASFITEVMLGASPSSVRRSLPARNAHAPLR
jgi:hypothetical protein